MMKMKLKQSINYYQWAWLKLVNPKSNLFWKNSNLYV